MSVELDFEVTYDYWFDLNTLIPVGAENHIKSLNNILRMYVE